MSDDDLDYEQYGDQQVIRMITDLRNQLDVAEKTTAELHGQLAAAERRHRSEVSDLNGRWVVATMVAAAVGLAIGAGYWWAIAGSVILVGTIAWRWHNWRMKRRIRRGH